MKSPLSDWPPNSKLLGCKSFLHSPFPCLLYSSHSSGHSFLSTALLTPLSLHTASRPLRVRYCLTSPPFRVTLFFTTLPHTSLSIQACSLNRRSSTQILLLKELEPKEPPNVILIPAAIPFFFNPSCDPDILMVNQYLT